MRSSCEPRISTAWRSRCRRHSALRSRSSSTRHLSKSADSEPPASFTPPIRRSCARTSTKRRSGSSRRKTSDRPLCRAGPKSPPPLRFCWNSNQTDLLDGGFEANFQLVKNQIGQVHMRDLMLEEYPWRKLITSLADMKFQGYCFAEIPESTDPVRVLKYFRGMFRAYQGL